MTIDSRDQRHTLDAAIASVDRIPLNARGGHDFLRQVLREARQRLAAAVVFRHMGRDLRGRDVFEIGREGDALRTVRTRCRGVWPVWALLDDERHGGPGELRVADHTKPDAAYPEDSLRRAIHRTAASEFDAWQLHDLQAAALRCTVAGGVVTLQRSRNAVEVITR